MKRQVSKNIFHFPNLIKALKKGKPKKKFFDSILIEIQFQKQKSKFWNSFFDFKSKIEFQNILSFLNFGYEI